MSDLPTVSDDEAKTLCKIGQRAACCRYLVCGADGFQCTKLAPDLAMVLDRRVAAGTMTAQGDNCPGKSQ